MSDFASLCTVDLSNEAFPFGTSQTTKMAGATVRASSYFLRRRTRLGIAHGRERRRCTLGCATADSPDWQPRDFGDARLEKAYRAMGHELSADETPLEAGLGFAIDWDKEFIGKAALVGHNTDLAFANDWSISY